MQRLQLYLKCSSLSISTSIDNDSSNNTGANDGNSQPSVIRVGL
ncbi:MAG TPA: hypothetical protein VGR14_08910 [Verrucomicrobiae bacterium]|nr:hypothetical protein [Verrucomicrobiae bacterium]